MSYLVDKQGYYGDFGGAYVPEILHRCVQELQDNYLDVLDSATFRKEYGQLLRDYVGRPSPLYLAKRLSARYGCRLYLKREDLNHTGAHKINNTVGQILLARHMGKRRIIAETGAGQHGVATATVCALAGMECVVYMGQTDVARQRVNVEKMRMLKVTMSLPDGERTGRALTEGYGLTEAVDDFRARFRVEGEYANYCGMYGYTSFNAVRYTEGIAIKDSREDINDAPDLLYIIYKYIIVFNDHRHELLLLEMAGEGEASTLDRIEKAYVGDDFKLYRALRSINPSPYLFYFDFGGFRLLGSSPETHLRVEGRRAYIAPIAGTTKRTGRKEEDDAAARYLRGRPGASLLRHLPRRHAERGAEGEGYGVDKRTGAVQQWRVRRVRGLHRAGRRDEPGHHHSHLCQPERETVVPGGRRHRGQER